MTSILSDLLNDLGVTEIPGHACGGGFSITDFCEAVLVRDSDMDEIREAVKAAELTNDATFDHLTLVDDEDDIPRLGCDEDGEPDGSGDPDPGYGVRTQIGFAHTSFERLPNWTLLGRIWQNMEFYCLTEDNTWPPLLDELEIEYLVYAAKG